MNAMHVHHAGERFGRCFATAKIFTVARVTRQEDVILHPVVAVFGQASRGTCRPMNDIALGDVPVPARGDHHLHNILNFFDGGRTLAGFALHRVHDELCDRQHFGEIGEAQSEPCRGVVGVQVGRVLVTRGVKRERNGAGDALGVPRGGAPVSFDDFGRGGRKWWRRIRRKRE